VENPYYQYFCGDEFYQHELVLDRSSLSNWRQRMGEERMMTLWVDWLDKWASVAIEEDPRFLDKDLLRAAIFKARNGEERFARRVVSRNAKGLPLWTETTVK
jgi:hypothetical protein